MRKLDVREGFWLLYFCNNGRTDDPFVREASLNDFLDSKAIDSLKELGYVDIETGSVTKEGVERAHFMLRAGINFDEFMKNNSLETKRALFLSLINSGYEPRGLFQIFIDGLSPFGFSQLKKAFFKRQNQQRRNGKTK